MIRLGPRLIRVLTPHVAIHICNGPKGYPEFQNLPPTQAPPVKFQIYRFFYDSVSPLHRSHLVQVEKWCQERDSEMRRRRQLRLLQQQRQRLQRRRQRLLYPPSKSYKLSRTNSRRRMLKQGRRSQKLRIIAWQSKMQFTREEMRSSRGSPTSGCVCSQIIEC